MSIKKDKVFVALSGGVDSSVAAALLKQAQPNNFEKLFGRPTPKGFRGYNIIGCHIRCFNVDGCGEKDAEDARRVAEQLDIAFYVFDLEKEYKEKVVQYMVDGYRRGLTPNPDVMCNKEIKFGLFLKRALELGADYVATGHYIRLRRNFEFRISNLEIYSKLKIRNSKLSLWQAKDLNKDQSYFLWTLTQEQLKYCLFPISEYTKPEVRKLAKKFGLLTAEKKDSQGVCFLGKITLSDFLKQYIPEKWGLVLNSSGKKIGEHNGVQFYTIGQRHGLCLSGAAKPLYISDKNINDNTITVAEGKDNENLLKSEIKLTSVNFISPEFKIKNSKLEILARVRYRQPLFKAILICHSREGGNLNKGFPIKSGMTKVASAKLIFLKPQKFVAAGQSAVFYSARRSLGEGGLELLGGGVIK